MQEAVPVGKGMIAVLGSKVDEINDFLKLIKIKDSL